MVDLVGQEVLLEPLQAVGIVGTRKLVCVQVLDIARLTPEPVAIVPGFVAVSGRGPRNDSNDSGKTSWLAAAALLLGDPDWSLHSSAGAQNTSALLFNPITAGVEEYPRADHGYIVGVFAYSGEAPRALTVWCRINDGSPYLKVRWREGVVLAEGETTRDRHQHADENWASLPSDSELGAQQFAEALYGPTPRALAYVSTRGDRQSGVSLLKMQTGSFKPAEIGAQLIALTGRQVAFEKEERHRAELDAKQRKLGQRRGDDDERSQREDLNLVAVQRRARAREHVKLASESWELHFARGFLDVLKNKSELETMLRQLEERLPGGESACAGAEQTLADLAEPDELRRRLGTALDEVTTLEGELEDASTKEAESKISLERVSARERELVAVADGWNDASVQRLAAKYEAADAAHEQAKAVLAVAEDKARAARERYEGVIAGEGGRAGELAGLLRAAGVDAQILVDVVELEDEVRDVWEPLLAPYVDAIVLAPSNLAPALNQLADEPGSMLVSGDEVELPAGIRAAPSAASCFLASLAGRATAASDPARVVDTDLGLIVVGGYRDPQIGRQARIDQAGLALRVAEQGRDELARSGDVCRVGRAGSIGPASGRSGARTRRGQGGTVEARVRARSSTPGGAELAPTGQEGAGGDRKARQSDRESRKPAAALPRAAPNSKSESG